MPVSETSPPIRVMVVDDHPMWRDSVARDLTEAGFEVVAALSEGAQAVRVAAAVRPDVVVLDLQLPDLSGVDVIRGLLAQQARARVLVLSASGEHGDVLETVKAGAAGYLTKSAKKEELVDAVRRTAEGEAVFTAGLAGLVLGEFRRLATAPAESGPDTPQLTERETEILRLVATGLSYKQIAERTRALPPDRAEPRPEHAQQAPVAQPGRTRAVRDRARPRHHLMISLVRSHRGRPVASSPTKSSRSVPVPRR